MIGPNGLGCWLACGTLLIVIAGSGCLAPSNPGEIREMPILETITAEEALLLIKENPDITIIDVRTTREYETGHIPGAVNIPASTTFIDWDLDPDIPYLVYCAAGGRSSSALRIMGEYGFTRVYNLRGGIAAWEKAGGTAVLGSG